MSFPFPFRHGTFRPFEVIFPCAICTKKEAFFLHPASSLQSTPLTQCLHLQIFFLLFPILRAHPSAPHARSRPNVKRELCREKASAADPPRQSRIAVPPCRNKKSGNHFPQKSCRIARRSGVRLTAAPLPKPPFLTPGAPRPPLPYQGHRTLPCRRRIRQTLILQHRHAASLSKTPDTATRCPPKCQPARFSYPIQL